jgi:Fe-S-cluster containining protein
MKCNQCGTCCRLFLVNLTEDEYKSGRYRTIFEEFGIVEDFEEAQMTGANILRQNDDGSCIYLKDNKCSIHSTRPESCRKFFCNSKKPEFREMIKKIEKYKKNKQGE